MTTSKTVVVGSHVFVDDPEVAWKDGDVLEVRGDVITVKCTSGEKVVRKLSTIFPKDTELPSNGVDDMTKLTYLHEPGVLQNISCRFDVNEIYTYTGSILIAVNPFQRLPHLYEKDVMKQYKGAALHDLSPHPFAIADSACRKMINEGISQSILVSGESGAGKTESTKMIMQYLAYMGGRAEADGRSVELQVLESSPVLEAFGNAKTVRNNNSSRFGKFVEIQFNDRGRISGAAIRTYLLERSRVCQVSDPKRNYHCFYMICAAPPECQIRKDVAHSPLEGGGGVKKAAIITQCAWRGRMARIELRKRKNADLEMAKTKDNEKLKSDLEEMRLQFQGGKVSGLLVGASDNEIINALTAENEELRRGRVERGERVAAFCWGFGRIKDGFVGAADLGVLSGQGEI